MVFASALSPAVAPWRLSATGRKNPRSWSAFMNGLEPAPLVWPEAETAYVRHRWRPGCAGHSRGAGRSGGDIVAPPEPPGTGRFRRMERSHRRAGDLSVGDPRPLGGRAPADVRRKPEGEGR